MKRESYTYACIGNGLFVRVGKPKALPRTMPLPKLAPITAKVRKPNVPEWDKEGK